MEVDFVYSGDIVLEGSDFRISFINTRTNDLLALKINYKETVTEELEEPISTKNILKLVEKLEEHTEKEIEHIEGEKEKIIQEKKEKFDKINTLLSSMLDVKEDKKED